MLNGSVSGQRDAPEQGTAETAAAGQASEKLAPNMQGRGSGSRWFGAELKEQPAAADMGYCVPILLRALRQALYAQDALEADGCFRRKPPNDVMQKGMRKRLEDGANPFDVCNDKVPVEVLWSLLKDWLSAVPGGLWGCAVDEGQQPAEAGPIPVPASGSASALADAPAEAAASDPSPAMETRPAPKSVGIPPTSSRSSKRLSTELLLQNPLLLCANMDRMSPKRLSSGNGKNLLSGPSCLKIMEEAFEPGDHPDDEPFPYFDKIWEAFAVIDPRKREVGAPREA